MNKKGGVMDEKNNLSHFLEGSEKMNDLPFEWLGLTSRKESNLQSYDSVTPSNSLIGVVSQRLKSL